MDPEALVENLEATKGSPVEMADANGMKKKATTAGDYILERLGLMRLKGGA